MFIMRKYEMLGFFIISLISVALALLFWVLPSNFLLDGLRPTTDSLWQVGKLMFISILIYSVAEYFIFGREFDNFMFAKAATLFIGPLLFIGLSYVFDLGLGAATFNAHVLTYGLALAAGQYASYYILRDGLYFRLMNGYAAFGIILMLALYIAFGRSTDRFSAPIFRPMDGYDIHIRYQQ